MVLHHLLFRSCTCNMDTNLKRPPDGCSSCTCNSGSSSLGLGGIVAPILSSLLDDPKKEEKESTSDRLSASTTPFAGAVVQASVKPTQPRDPDFHTEDDFLSMAYTHKSAEANPKKMIQLNKGQWTLAQARNTIVAAVVLPEAFWNDSGKPAYGQSRYFKYVRTGFHFQVQINAQTGAAGSLIVVYMPRAAYVNYAKMEFDSFMNLPHVILNCATVTQGDLFIPYINETNYVETDSNGLGNLMVFVWTPLTSPTGSSNTVDVAIYGTLLDLDFQNPRAFTNRMEEQAPPDRMKKKKYPVSTKYKWVREKIDIAEGPGSMNIANRLSTAGGQSLALVGERAYYDPRTAGTKTRINNMLEIYQVPALLKGPLGVFNWAASQAPGSAVHVLNMALTGMANINVGTSCYQYYRGSIEVILTIYASSFNKGRLKICFYPNDDKDFSYENSNNSQYLLCDVGLNSTFKMTIPYAAKTWQRSTKDIIGRLKIFVVNRLTFNSSSPNAINCTLATAAGKDFLFSVPTEDDSTYQSWGSEMDLTDPIDDPKTIMEQNNPKNFDSEDVVYSQDSQMVEKIGLAAAENVGTQDEQIQASQPYFLNYKVIKRNIYAVSHTDIDNIYGRAWYVRSDLWETDQLIQLGLNPPTTGHAVQMRFFGYYAGEVNIHITNDSEKPLDVAHAYDLAETEMNVEPTSQGVISIPPGEMMTVCAPWYSKNPVREMRPETASDASATFGVLLMKPEAATGRYIVRMSLRNPQMFFKLPAPKKITSLEILHSQNPEMYLLTKAHVRSWMNCLKKDAFDFYRKPKCEERTPLQKAIEAVKDWFADDHCQYTKQKLLKSGDVEQNPGPMQLVYIDRGIYKHYGLRTDEGVWNLNTDNVLQAAFTGQAEMILSPNSEQWKVEKQIDQDYFQQQYLQHLKGSKHIFSCSVNCESLAREISGERKLTQTQVLGIASMVILTATFTGLATQGGFCDMSHKQFFQQGVSGDTSAMTSVIQRMVSFVSTTCVEALKSHIARTLIFFLMRVLCYLIMYCHNPSILSTMALGALLVMDVKALNCVSGETQGLLKALLEGDMRKLATIIVESVQHDTEEEKAEMCQETFKQANAILGDPIPSQFETMDESIGDFNKFSQASKHLEWWVEKIQKLIDWLRSIFCPTKSDMAIKWIEKNFDLVSSLISSTSTHLVNMKDPVYARKKQNHDFHRYLLSRLSWLVQIFAEGATPCPVTGLIMRLHSEMLKVQIGMPIPGTMYRMEPIGIWIAGSPGQGKSFFSHALIQRIMTETKLATVWPHPVGSEYMDGYCGQDIHIIDDLGQSREEKDVELLCQCISSIPFSVPMASLTEKGCSYQSKFVVATTNKTDFTTNTLADPKALERRFPFNFTIRCKTQYLKKGMINVPETVAIMSKGTPWEYTNDGRNWKSMDLDKLVAELTAEYEKRQKALNDWQTFNQDPPRDWHDCFEGFKPRYPKTVDYVRHLSLDLDTCVSLLNEDRTSNDCPLKCFQTEKKKFDLEPAELSVLEWLKAKFASFKNFLQKNVIWIKVMSILATFTGLAFSVWAVMRNNESDERAYNPQATPPKGGLSKLVAKATERFEMTHNQAPYQQDICHLQSLTCYFSSESNPTHTIHGIVLGDNRVLTFGHSKNWFLEQWGLALHYKNHKFPLDEVLLQDVVFQGKPMDLMIIKCVGLPMILKNVSKYYSPKLGKNPLLIWNTHKGYIIKEVQDPYRWGENKTKEGSTSYRTIRYKANTIKGMCGGLLVSEVDGSYKVNGMHIAGNGWQGVAAELGNFSTTEQGMVVEKSKTQTPVFSPCRSELKESPVYELWPVVKEPAVLHPKDPRIEVECSNVVLRAAEKYPGNVYEAEPPLMDHITTWLASQFVTKIGKHGILTIEEAVVGPDGLNSIDLQTSPGVKYSKLGLKKRDLVKYEPELWISPRLERDCKQMMDQLVMNELDHTDVGFGTYLKDELRTIAKVKEANTRCIEAAPLDYTVVHRQIMGGIYSKIYELPSVLLGLAPGINPWTDFDQLSTCLLEYNYDLDFSKFDGSLSWQIMKEAVDILKQCSEYPHLVESLFGPVILSKHFVFDEEWIIKGGMPSGAPCTTIMNSLCNILMCRYCALVAGGIHRHDDIFVVTYGDDVILSTAHPLDTDLFVDLMYSVFGMKVTNAQKTLGVKETPEDQLVFLKRKFVYFPGTQFTVGQLDIVEMKQNIMWMKNMANFPEQLQCFENELVLHGKLVYEETMKEMEIPLKKVGVHMCSYELAKKRMIGYVFN